MKTFNYTYPVNVYFGEGSAKTAFSNELKKYGKKVELVLEHFMRCCHVLKI